MIYFNENFEACAYKISNPICTVDDELWKEVCNDNDAWTIENGQFIDLRNTPEYQEIVEQREEAKLTQLSLTKREVFLALYANKGVTPEQIRSKITDPAALIEFDYAERYYRGNVLIDLIGQRLGYTKEQLDNLFKNGSF